MTSLGATEVGVRQAQHSVTACIIVQEGRQGYMTGLILMLPPQPSGKRMVRANESKGDSQRDRAPSPLTLVQVRKLLVSGVHP